jgi:membrane protease YdiL (CAAX protease family)
MALVSAVIGLADGKPLAHVGRLSYQYVFPYFKGGIAFAGLVSGAYSRPVVWRGAVILLPVIVLGYLYSRSGSAVFVPTALHSARTKDEEFLEVG